MYKEHRLIRQSLPERYFFSQAFVCHSLRAPQQQSQRNGSKTEARSDEERDAQPIKFRHESH